MLVAVVLGVAVWGGHGGALGGKFHYDDMFAVVSNPAVRSWQPARAFTSVDAVISERGGASYRPLMVFSLALNARVFGLDPRGYLATNLALHFLIAGLIVLVGRELLGDLKWATVAGALYALHPVNAEAVNYVTARSSLLVSLFALATAWGYLRYLEHRGGSAALAMSLVAFIAALLSKESAVALVAPIVAYPWLSGRVRPMQDMRARWAPLAFVGIAVLYVVLWRLATAGAGTTGPPAHRPVWTFLELAARSLVLWVWPWPLGLDHPLTFLSRFDAGMATAIVLGIVGLLAIFLPLARREPVAAWGLLWALAGLAPLAPLPWLTTVGLLQEHRIGLSAVGLAWMTAALARAVWEVAGQWRFERIARVGLAGVGAVLALAAVGVDRSRSAVWQDDRRLWGEVVAWSPDNMLARINLGAAYMEAGEYDRAQAEYRAIIALAPGYPRVYYNLGLLALRRNDVDEATAAFRRTLEVDPHNPAVHAHLGILALRRGDRHEAEAQFQSALRDDPAQRDALNNLAAIYLERRDFSGALNLVDEALQRDPSFLEASYNKGVALAGLGRRGEADAVLQEVRARLPPEAEFDQYRKGIDHLLAGGQP